MANKPNSDEQAQASESDEKILEIARKRFDLAAEAESESRKEQLEDLQFRAGKQWPDDIKNQRQFDRRPCLTINKLPQFVNQITNDQRQNRPSIKVNPVGNGATLETAKVFQGLIRHIENISNADVAYDTSFEGAATKGLGYFRVITDYCDPMSFDQEIFIKRVRDSFTVYLDPFSQEPDGSDSNWGFVFEDMPRDEFLSQHPGADLSKMEDWVSIGDKAPGWINKDSVRVSEYLYKTFKKVNIALLSDGQVFEKSKLPPLEALANAGLKIVKERTTILPAIKWCKVNGVEVLERTDWLGLWIPIIPVLGSELIVDGQRILEGIIRQAKDPQRMYNYWATAETETIALAPKAPFIGAAGQFKGFEEQWKSANIKNHAFLEYNPTSLNGQPIGPPTRNVFEPPIMAISAARGQSSDDLKATTGIYDATLGNRSNEQSGVAIMRRNTQAQTSNYHYIDNLTRALRHCGRILVDLIPKVYDTPRIGRLIGEDGESEMVQLNQVFKQNGTDTVHDLSAGKYDVTITTGPSYTTKRQEAAETMMTFTKYLPQTAPLIADLIARNMDWPGAQEIADRLKKTLPPGIAENDKDKQMPVPPQVQAEMQQMGNLIKQLTDHLNLAQDEIGKKKYELDSKERIALAKIQADIEIALAEMQTDGAQALLKHQVGAIQHRLDSLDQSDNGNGTPAGTPAAPAPQDQPPTGGLPPGTSMGG